jgi:hypothetical protein
MQLDDGKPRSSQVVRHRAVKSRPEKPTAVKRTYRPRSDVPAEKEPFVGHVNPRLATTGAPGSEEKIVVLTARYAAGLPLWHDDDRLSHEAQCMKNMLDRLAPDEDDTDDDD